MLELPRPLRLRGLLGLDDLERTSLREETGTRYCDREKVLNFVPSSAGSPEKYPFHHHAWSMASQAASIQTYGQTRPRVDQTKVMASDLTAGDPWIHRDGLASM